MRERETPSPSETLYSPLASSPPYEHFKYLHFVIEDEGVFQEMWEELCYPLIVSSTRAGGPSVLVTTLLKLSSMC